jgi:hypothetical protein
MAGAFGGGGWQRVGDARKVVEDQQAPVVSAERVRGTRATPSTLSAGDATNRAGRRRGE